MFDLNKRQKIIVTSFFVTLGLLSTQMVDFNLRFRFLAGLTVFTYGISLWALWEGINKTKALILLILPTFFTLGIASFYFILPIRWLTRLPVALTFGFLFYLLLLSQNVFNVAAKRTIPLYRAAFTSAMLFTVLATFFLFSVLHAFNLLFLWNGILAALISLPLILQILWSVDMDDFISPLILGKSLLLSVVMGEIALVFSFWPMGHFMWAIALATTMYILVGLAIGDFRKQLNRRVVWEYLGIGGAVLLVAFLTTSWGS